MEKVLPQLLAIGLLVMAFIALALVISLIARVWMFIQHHRRRKRLTQLMRTLIVTPENCRDVPPTNPAITSRTELAPWHGTPIWRDARKEKHPPPWIPSNPLPPGTRIRANYESAEKAWYDFLLGHIRLSAPTPRHAVLRAWGQILVYTMTEEEQREFDNFLSQSPPPDQMPSDTQLWPWLKDLPPEDAKYVLKYVKFAYRRRYKGRRKLSLIAEHTDATSPSSPPPLAPSWRRALAKVAPLQASAWGQAPIFDADQVAPRLLTVLRHHLVNCSLSSQSDDYERLLAAHILAVGENERETSSLAALAARVRQNEKEVVAWLQGWMKASNVTARTLRRLAQEQGIWPSEITIQKEEEAEIWPLIPILAFHGKEKPCREGRSVQFNSTGYNTFQVILDPSPEMAFDLLHATTRVHVEVAAQYGFDLKRGPILDFLLTLTTHPRERRETYCVHIDPTTGILEDIAQVGTSHELILTVPSHTSRHLRIPQEEISQFWAHLHHYQRLQETWQRQGLWFPIGQTPPEWSNVMAQAAKSPPGKGAGTLIGSLDDPLPIIVCRCADTESWMRGQQWYLGVGGDVSLARNPPTLRLDITASVVGETGGQKACVTQLCVPLNEWKVREWLHALGKPSNVMIVLAGENTHVACALGAQTKIAGKLAAIVNMAQRTANGREER